MNMKQNVIWVFGINHVTRITLWWKKKSYNMFNVMVYGSRVRIMDQRWMSLNHRLYESQLNGHGFLPSLNTNMWIMNPVDRVWSDAVAGMDSWWLDNTGAAWCSRRYRGNKTQTCWGRNHQLYCIWIAKFSYIFSSAINETIKHIYLYHSLM